MTAENLAGFLPESLTPEQRSNIARFGAASLAFLTNQDVNAAIQAATTAVEFNFNAHKATKLSRTVPEQEFVDEMMKAEQAERGTFLPEQRELWEYKFRKLYYTLKQTDLSRSLLDPGRQRFEEQASLSFDEFKAQYLSQMDPQKMATVQGRQDGERIIRNHFNFYQSKGFDLTIAPLFGIVGGGVASFKPMYRKGRVATVAETSAVPSRNVQALNLEGEVQVKKSLLPGEGKVGTFGELNRLAQKGDNLTPHHMPQSSYMKEYGVIRDEGISMMMEQPNPGQGGRHRYTRTYGRKPNFEETPREALARDIKDARQIYQEDKLYTPEVRESLQQVVEKNKAKFPKMFEKKE